MKIKVEFPLLSNKFSGVEITGDVKRYGIGAIKISEKPAIVPRIFLLILLIILTSLYTIILNFKSTSWALNLSIIYIAI